DSRLDLILGVRPFSEQQFLERDGLVVVGGLQREHQAATRQYRGDEDRPAHVAVYNRVADGRSKLRPYTRLCKEMAMEDRKKASDYPQELLDLFHEYQHGEITRRDFLDRAKKFAGAGVTAMALYESLKPNYAWAQQVKQDDTRIKTEYATVQSPEGNGSIKG